ncbi:ROK family protein [Novosphingobium sp. 1949]|uniref:ROK family protein n=1 Tax=Novosphingobium organovorum TaxID=2930092 RepID=A0ABT0BI62_9SPHN|nr:ROK family transcriptional regulator [Novosphingobium organovorum]MCJ2184750.1 ROK family protein [Novosphingobium organovorum]
MNDRIPAVSPGGAARAGRAETDGAPLAAPLAGEAGHRLSVSLSGTNLARAGDYNQRIVLQAIRLAGETTRQLLVRQTGLTAPTIANIAARLEEMGLVTHAGRRHGSRGQPALRLAINPDGAFGIGLNIDRDHVTLALLDLAGSVRGSLTREMAFALPGDVVAFVGDVLPGLMAAGGVDPALVLGVGVARPDGLGSIAIPHRPQGYAAWTDIDFATLLAPVMPWPIHVDNDAAAAALGEAKRIEAPDKGSFFYLLLSAGLGGAPVIDGGYYRGARARSGEIGLMPDPGAGVPGAVVQDTVSLSALQQRLERAGKPVADLTDLLALDPATATTVDRWIADSTRALTAPLVAVSCLLDPEAILVGGRLPAALIERLCARIDAALAEVAMPNRVPVRPAQMADAAPAIGAALLPFQDRLLPSDAILMQAGRAPA